MILFKQGSRKLFYQLKTEALGKNSWTPFSFNGDFCLFLTCFNRAFSSLIDAGDTVKCV